MSAPVLAKLFMWIKRGKAEAFYHLSPIPTDKRVALKAWKVQRGEQLRNDDAYEVYLCPKGYYYCSCGDFRHRSKECKHIKALRDMGLI